MTPTLIVIFSVFSASATPHPPRGPSHPTAIQVDGPTSRAPDAHGGERDAGDTWTGAAREIACHPGRRALRTRSRVAEAVDLLQVPGPHRLVVHAQALLRGEAQHPDLALMEVAVDVPRGVAGLVQRVALGQRGVDEALRDEAVRLPCLPVVGEVRPDDPLEVHPQVPVVVLVPEPAGRGAGDDGAPALRDVHARPERLPPGMLEHDVRVLAGELADPRAEALPLPGVLRLLVLPEPEPLRLAVDDQLGTHAPAELGLVVAGHDADGDRPTVERHLRGVRSEPAGGAPDEHDVALLHRRTVLAHQLAVGGGV